MDDFRGSSPITSRILPEVERERPLLRPWVEQMVTLCQPDDVVWCDGSQRNTTVCASSSWAKEPFAP